MEKRTNINISFCAEDFDLLKQNIGQFKNQSIQIISTPEYRVDAELLYIALKKEFRVSISYISKNSCYKNSGINTLWCGIRENVRLFIALGDESSHNATKRLAIKSGVSYAFLSRDYPNIYSLLMPIIDADLINSRCENNKLNICDSINKCIFLNYNLENAKRDTCAYNIGQALGLVLFPFENYVDSKINSVEPYSHFNYLLLKKINSIMGLEKQLNLGVNNAKTKLSKYILTLSKLLLNNDAYSNALYDYAIKFCIRTDINMDYLPIYQFFSFQLMSKILLNYCINNQESPLSISFSNLMNEGVETNIVKAKLTDNQELKSKVNYIFCHQNKLITSWITKLNNLQASFANIIRNLALDSGYAVFSNINYKELLDFIKLQCISQKSGLYADLDLVKII